jgi:uncharacterized protein (DUF4415 family)
MDDYEPDKANGHGGESDKSNDVFSHSGTPFAAKLRNDLTTAGERKNMKKASTTESSQLSEAQRADLAAVVSIEPDTTDIAEAPAANWAYARRFFKPRKAAISLRLDADVLDWLRNKHERYQPEINRILRQKNGVRHVIPSALLFDC